tara:strand:+ start:21776 stop:23029 length:1254 start_codon:yes stop_codon:yes gene_type:complete
MKNMLVFLGLALCATCLFSGEANACEQLLPNSGLKIYSSDTTKCANIKYLNIGNTVIVAEPSFQKNASYKITVKTPSGTTLLSETIERFSDSLIQKLDTQSNDDIEVFLEPLTADMNYNFAVAHDENTATNNTIIYIGLNSSKKASVTPAPPYDPRCDPQCEIPQMLQLIDTSVFYSTSNVNIASDSPQCNDENRPPEDAPTNEKQQKLNVNQILKDSTSWNQILLGEGLTELENNVIRLLRVRAMHSINGSLDLAHTSSTTGYKGSFSMGNFLYGANASALGLSPSVILRGSHAYQALSDAQHADNWHGGWAQGIWNYMTASGDNVGDQQEVLRGIKYHRDVFMLNSSDTASLSCEDLESIANGSSGSTGGGGGPPSGGSNSGGSSGGRDGGYIRPSNPEVWCFEQDGYPTYCWVV